MPRLEAFKPEMIFISAGFDAHRDDDLGQLGLVEDDYAWITERIKDVARRHAKGRIVSCLEGGYNLDALARSVEAHLRVLADVVSRSPARRRLADGSDRSTARTSASSWLRTQPGAVVSWRCWSAACSLAWLVVRAGSRRDQPSGSIWFGERIFDGLLFPLLALLFADLARARLVLDDPAGAGVPAWRCRCSCRWWSIRLIGARAEPRPSRPRAGARWSSAPSPGWPGSRVVLWIIGAAAAGAGRARRASRWKIGKSAVSLRTLVEGTLSAPALVLVIALWISATIEKRVLRKAIGTTCRCARSRRTRCAPCCC